MKTIIAVLLVSTMALSFSAEAVSCKDIGVAVVDQYVAVAGYKIQTEEQINAYNGLVASQVGACLNGKTMRESGVAAKDAGSAMTIVAVQAVAKGNSSSAGGLSATAMTQVSFSYGYAFGE